MCKSLSALIVAIVVAWTLAWAGDAHAQTDTFALERLQLAGAPDDGIALSRPRMYEKTRFYGQLALGYTQHPLRDTAVAFRSNDLDQMDHPVSNQLDSFWVLGTEIGGRVGINLTLPVAFLTDGGGTDDSAYAYPRTSRSPSVGDLKLDGRVAVWRSKREKHALGLGASLFLPTGSGTAYTSDRQVTGFMYANYDVIFKGWYLTANLGAHVRPKTELDNLVVGTELRYGVGAYIPFRDDSLVLGLELWGTTGIPEYEVSSTAESRSTFFGERNTDFEWLLQGKYRFGKDKRIWAGGGAGTRIANGYGSPDFRMLASIGYWFTIKDSRTTSPPRQWIAPPDVEDHESDRDGDGYPDDVDACPDDPEDGEKPFPSDGCPRTADRDDDGVPDADDKCPTTAEDKDGVDDGDGCPEQDADNDEIPDAEDACPTAPGPRSEIAEKHGCPQLTRVTEDGRIALLEPIQFDTGTAVIKAVSFPILDEVVALMKARPALRIGVYGHTDSVGSAWANKKLSTDRAASVMKYIIDKGVAADRLESAGFGEDEPIATNDTPEGRAQNRRVDFKMLDGQ